MQARVLVSCFRWLEGAEPRAALGASMEEEEEEAPSEASAGGPAEPFAALAFQQRRLAGQVAALRSEQGGTLRGVTASLAKMEQDIGQVLMALQLRSLGEPACVNKGGSVRQSAENPDGTSAERLAAAEAAAVAGGINLPDDWPTCVGPRFAEETPGMGSTPPSRPTCRTIFAQQKARPGEMSLSQLSKTSSLTRAQPLGFVEKYFILDPNSSKHLAYSMLTWPFLLWDLTFIPYALAWDVPLQGFSLLQAWVATCFWTFDLAMSFLTGFPSGGEVTKDPYMIANNFFRTWLVPDLLAVVSDWVSMVFVLLTDRQQNRALSTFRLVRLGRLLRIVSMLRVLKLLRILEDCVDRHFLENQRLALRFCALFFGICWVTHLMSCAWYAIGTHAHSDTGMRWTDSQEFGSSDWHLYAYTSSFHWAISQISLGATDITSYNSTERIFSVFCLMCGLLIGSVLISLLSSTMVDFRASRKERNQRLLQMRRFLADNNIPRKLALRVQRQVTERLDEKDMITDRDVLALRLLSNSVRRELAINYFQPRFILHPLFRLSHHLEPTLINHICAHCLEMNCLRPTDELFAPGPARAASYMLSIGKMTYSQEPASSRVERACTEAVDSGRWIAEAALWSVWTHVGCLQACSGCRVLVVGAQALEIIIRSHTACGEIVWNYCAVFHKRVTAARPPDLPWPNDLQVPFTEYADLVMSMDRDHQLLISRAALEHKAGKSSPAGISYFYAAQAWRTNIEEELQQGRCTLVVNGGGVVERVAVVLVLCIEQGVHDYVALCPGSSIRPDASRAPRASQGSVRSLLSESVGSEKVWRRVSILRRFREGVKPGNRSTMTLRFVELAKQEEEDGPVAPACQLPGDKLGWGESSAAAYRRILHSKLGPLADNVEYLCRERLIEHTHYKFHGVLTKYLITVCKAKTRMPIEAPMHRLTAESVRGVLVNGVDASNSASSKSAPIWRKSWKKASCGLSIVHAGLSVYKIDDSVHGGAAYYAWLDQESFDFLRSPAGEPALARLVAGFAAASFSASPDVKMGFEEQEEQKE